MIADAGAVQAPKVPPTRARWLRFCLLGVVPAVMFLTLASTRLTRQGLYYDELHQAPAAFMYVGSPAELFVVNTIGQVPTMNMFYTGAIKSAIYGAYLRFVNPNFGVASWRLVGILFVAAALLMFGPLLRARLGFAGTLIVLGLLLTDASVLLMVRHDWGPAALGLALRLVLLAVWLRSEVHDAPPLWSSFVIAGLVGFAVFEKLSSVVLVAPLGLILLARALRRPTHIAAGFAGLVVGALPLIMVNWLSFSHDQYLVSFLNLGAEFDQFPLPFLSFAWEYLRLGAGDTAREFILSSDVPFVVRWAEPILMIAVLSASAVLAARTWRARPESRLALIALASYAAVAFSLFLLPRETRMHHWINGTPFHYIAIGLALPAASSWRIGVMRRVLPVAVGILLVLRSIGALSLQQSLIRGDTSAEFSPSSTQIAEFAARQAGKAVFATLEWGLGTQIYCVANGRPGFVYEVYGRYRGPEDFLEIQRTSGLDTLYAVGDHHRIMNNAERMIRDLETSRDWREVAVEPEVANLARITIKKFVYVGRENADVEP